MSTRIKQVDQKVLVLSRSNPLTMLATLSNNTTATIGTVEPSRFVKIDTQEVDLAWVVAMVAAGVMEAVSACAVVSVVAEEDLAGAEASEAVAMDEVDMEVATVVVVAVGEEDTVAPVLLRSQLRQTPSPTTPPMEVNGVRSSSFET